MLANYNSLIDFIHDKAIISVQKLNSLDSIVIQNIKLKRALSDFENLLLKNDISILLKICSCRISNPVVMSLSDFKTIQGDSTNPNIVTCIIGLEGNTSYLLFPEIERKELFETEGKAIFLSNIFLEKNQVNLTQFGNNSVIIINITLFKIEQNV